MSYYLIWWCDDFFIDIDFDWLDIFFIYDVLIYLSWFFGIDFNIVCMVLVNSLCFGFYCGK